MINLNLLFNKSYYEGLQAEKSDLFTSKLKARNREICGVRFSESDYRRLPEKICPHTILMKTGYPGLLVGTGYAHQTGDGSEECAKLGFTFDYVSGQPYVPGSSVKGMLRSCFKAGLDGDEGKTAAGEVLKGILGLEEDAGPKALEALLENIFEGEDIFFDAVLRRGDKEGRVMAEDYITPHGKDTTKNPTPLLMLKVRPGVVFEFRFRLSDFSGEGLTVTAEQKKELFSTLLELFGVGAKTNVGYGVLEAISPEDLKTRSAPDRTAQRQEARQTGTQAPVSPRPAAGQTAQRQEGPRPAARAQKCPGCSKNTVQPGKIVCAECERFAREKKTCAICKRNKVAAGYSDLLCLTCLVKYSPKDTKR